MQTSDNVTLNPKVNFGVIHEAIEQFKGNWGTWMFAALIYVLIVFGFGHIKKQVTGVTTSSHKMSVVMRLFIPASTSMMPEHPILILISLALSVFIIFFTAGLYKMATKKIRGYGFSIRDLVRISSAEATSLFAYAIAIWIFKTCIGLALSHLWYQSALHPQSPVFRTLLYLGLALQILIAITWGGLFMFTLPLIVDQQMNLIDAISKSITTLKHQWLMAILFFIVIEIIIIIGLFCCLVGILITIPIGILSITVLYRNFFIGSSSPPPPSGKQLFEPAIPPGG